MRVAHTRPVWPVQMVPPVKKKSKSARRTHITQPSICIYTHTEERYSVRPSASSGARASSAPYPARCCPRPITGQSELAAGRTTRWQAGRRCTRRQRAGLCQTQVLNTGCGRTTVAAARCGWSGLFYARNSEGVASWWTLPELDTV